MMKGQSVLLSHAILVGFSVLLLFVIVSTLNGVREDYQDFISEANADQLCLVMKNSIERIYIEPGYASPSNTTYGTLLVKLPERIAGKDYIISLINANKSASVEIGQFSSNCTIGFNASYSGSTTGGDTAVRFVQYSNGTKLVEVARI